jgi:hypothetical protein
LEFGGQRASVRTLRAASDITIVFSRAAGGAIPRTVIGHRTFDAKAVRPVVGDDEKKRRGRIRVEGIGHRRLSFCRRCRSANARRRSAATLSSPCRSAHCRTRATRCSGVGCFGCRAMRFLCWGPIPPSSTTILPHDKGRYHGQDSGDGAGRSQTGSGYLRPTTMQVTLSRFRGFTLMLYPRKVPRRGQPAECSPAECSCDRGAHEHGC